MNELIWFCLYIYCGKKINNGTKPQTLLYTVAYISGALYHATFFCLFYSKICWNVYNYLLKSRNTPFSLSSGNPFVAPSKAVEFVWLKTNWKLGEFYVLKFNKNCFNLLESNWDGEMF